jgi:CheY-specific phosphatase CheX
MPARHCRNRNDQGFHFRVHPPLLLTSDKSDKPTEDTEALVICFGTSLGDVFMNVALRHSHADNSLPATAGA